MANIRQKTTRAEQTVASLLRSMGAHYRLNVRGLPGSPDFSNRRRGWAIFVHGCFWHAHAGCCRATIPKSNTVFWLGKFADNQARDARAVEALGRAGIRVLVVWECELKELWVLRQRLSEFLEPGRIDM